MNNYQIIKLGYTKFYEKDSKEYFKKWKLPYF